MPSEDLEGPTLADGYELSGDADGELGSRDSHQQLSENARRENVVAAKGIRQSHESTVPLAA